MYTWQLQLTILYYVLEFANKVRKKGKITNGKEYLNNRINKLDINDICRTVHPTVTESSCFQWHTEQILMDHLLGHKTISTNLTGLKTHRIYSLVGLN